MKLSRYAFGDEEQQGIYCAIHTRRRLGLCLRWGAALASGLLVTAFRIDAEMWTFEAAGIDHPERLGTRQ